MGQDASRGHRKEASSGKADARKHGHGKHAPGKHAPGKHTGHSAPLPYSAREWSLLFDDTLDKWRKLRGIDAFDAFKMCRRKQEKQHDPKELVQWSTSLCSDVTQEKLSSSFAYQIHGTSRKATTTYADNPVMAKILNDSRLIKYVPSSDKYLVLFFKETSLDAVTHHVLVVIDTTSTSSFLYFFLERPPVTEFDVEQLVVSPDVDRACVLLSARYMDGLSFQIQVYSRRPDAFASDFEGCTFEIEYEIPGILPCFGSPKMAFDPRFYASRLGILNIQAIQGFRVADYVTVYDLQQKRTLTSTACSVDGGDVLRYDLLDGDYSPDGAWVYALVVRPRHVENETNATLVPYGKITRYIMVFNSDTALLTQILDIGADNIAECFLNFAPSFSRCGRKVAIRSRRNVMVFQLPQERTLRAMCRAVLRANYDPAVLERMDAPLAVRRYINLLPAF